MMRVHILRALVVGLALCAAPSFAAEDVPIVDETRGDFNASHLSFQSRVQVSAACKEVFTSLTNFDRLQQLVPHLHATAIRASSSLMTGLANKLPSFANAIVGDALAYEYERKDGSKATGRMVSTTVVENEKVQLLVQPDQGPWLRVQEFSLYAPKGGEARCDVIYEETYNPRTLKNAAYDISDVVQHIRAPYMDIILRRLKNIAEGKTPGPADEVEKLREIAKNFP